MTEILVPGVYVREVSTGARPIEAVGTSTAGFVGAAPRDDARVGEPVLINNWSQFRGIYCVDAAGDARGGDARGGTPLAWAVYGFFQNGGTLCYVVNTGRRPPDGTQANGVFDADVSALETIDEVAIVAAPGCTDAASYTALLNHCEKMTDRVAVLDAADVKEVDALLPATEAAADQKPASSPGTPAAPAAGALAVGGTPGATRPTGTPAAGGAPREERGSRRPRPSDNGFGALYYPWLRIADPFNPKAMVDVPPSGHIAGIYARTDATRGVHKAPANELVRGALAVTRRVTRAQQGLLNPVGVNCIRFFPREGIRVWGARTLAPGASEWRYLNVRRLFSMIEKSISLSTRWIVFEPNDATLWKAIRRDVSAFLTLLWRQGALMGSAPEDAFFVRCDNETNTQADIDAGRVRTLIGIAPVKPAEFVIFEIGQSAAGAEVVVAGAG